MNIRQQTREWWKSGSPWIWLNAGAVTISVLMVVGLLLLIAIQGLSYFWPADVFDARYRNADGSVERLIGEITGAETIPVARARDNGYPIEEGGQITRYVVKIGNRDLYGFDFKPIFAPFLFDVTYPEEIIVGERREWGNFYGYLQRVLHDGKVVAEGKAARAALAEMLPRSIALFEEVESLRKHDIGAINYQMERLRLERRRLELDGVKDPSAYEDIARRKAELQQEYERINARIAELGRELARGSLVIRTQTDQEITVPLAKVVRIYYPNAMSVFEKLGTYFSKIWEFVSAEPREANTEGGVFPAIFGTVLMVLLMAVLVTPFGVIAAVYLREYARQGVVIRTIRIAVNNLAGVPSIVYGVFGLGFFVYFLGGNIDALFFPEAQPAPTFGTPGILWSSLTLALLTLPVVIVSTEEGLARIPRAIREGSLALGATKAETLWRIVIPMASPAMMTGLILAVARAAGEVAPLMLVGVVKLAPSLPLDGNFPYLHLERKFMHLGFHIYDVGFQSPNVEAARPLVYATSLLLILLIVLLNLTAIRIRNRLREKYRAMEH